MVIDDGKNRNPDWHGIAIHGDLFFGKGDDECRFHGVDLGPEWKKTCWDTNSTGIVFLRNFV